MAVQTAKVQGRRKVAYKSFDELLADADRISSGPVKTLGNWSPGQIFRHLAIAFNGSIDGFKTGFPWFMRFVARMFKNKLINGAMPPGIKVPAKFAKQVMPDATSTEDGLAQLHAAVARLKREPQLRQASGLRQSNQGGVGQDPLEPREPAHEFSGSGVNVHGAFRRGLETFGQRGGRGLETRAQRGHTFAERKATLTRGLETRAQRGHTFAERKATLTRGLETRAQPTFNRSLPAHHFRAADAQTSHLIHVSFTAASAG